MKILFLCHRSPYPPQSGANIRAFNMIKWLSARHELTVLSIARSPDELAKGEGIRKYCHHLEMGLISPFKAWLQAMGCVFTGKPSSLGYFYVRQLRAVSRRLISEEEFDLIWVHSSSVAQYVFDAQGPYRVMDFVDIDSEKWLRYASQRNFPLSLVYLREGIKLRRYEKQLAVKFDECAVVAPAERKILESYGTNALVTVIPNGVDLDYFTNPREDYDPHSLVFLGRMDYFPNVDGITYLCREVLPLIRREIPEVKLAIVGSNPTRRIRRLSAIPGVTVTGGVPDVRPYLQPAAVSVVPLRIAVGIQNKVLESMAMRVPVVASSQAFDGVDAVEGEHLLVDDTAQGFATKVLSLMRDATYRRQLSEAGRRRIQERYSWPSCLQRLDSLIEASTSKRAERNTESQSFAR